MLRFYRITERTVLLVQLVVHGSFSVGTLFLSHPCVYLVVAPLKLPSL